MDVQIGQNPIENLKGNQEEIKKMKSIKSWKTE